MRSLPDIGVRFEAGSDRARFHLKLQFPADYPAGAPKLTEAEKANPLYGGGSGGGAPALPALQTNASSEGASEKKKALWPTKEPTAPANEGGVSYEGELSPNGGYGGRPLRWDD